ncbi:hypothetical protein PIB30_047973 [Stylosanthes scabra]|uniref:Uncharacterized protein n=1 Tax=Stylosanthes scabra TaxID=79078 RepID=A0ABU6RHI8_9FABA|nr:hypothetical protein [Stylosanthes scabra]
MSYYSLPVIIRQMDLAIARSAVAAAASTSAPVTGNLLEKYAALPVPVFGIWEIPVQHRIHFPVGPLHASSTPLRRVHALGCDIVLCSLSYRRPNTTLHGSKDVVSSWICMGVTLIYVGCRRPNNPLHISGFGTGYGNRPSYLRDDYNFYKS